VTFHHVWWADNVDQRMPRIRYGKIHILNSLYTAAGNNYCIGVGQGASVRNENNVFIDVRTPVNTTSFVDAASTVTSVGNIYTNTSGQGVTDIGTAFTPPYSYTPEPASSVEAAVRSGAGPQ
jgi:pectate lyase